MIGQLFECLKSGVINNVEEIASILDEYFDTLEDSGKQHVVSSIKDAIQKEANSYIEQNGGNGAIIAGTGVGKTRIGIMRVKTVVEKNADAKILIVVPTKNLRDRDWLEEFTKWGELDIYLKNIETTCYASLNKHTNTVYDLVILDELHTITPTHRKFFKDSGNTIINIMGLTATRPQSEVKKDFLKYIGLMPVYCLSIDQASRLRIVAPYNIYVVDIKLNDRDKNIKNGTKNNSFFKTERDTYVYLSRRHLERPSRFLILKRLNFIRNIPSKVEAAKLILDNVIPQDKRTVIFCGSIKQADILCKDSFHSKKRDRSALQRFDDKEINRFSCVDAVNEGVNLDHVDCLLITHCGSVKLNMEQRLGRGIRFRPGGKCTVIILCLGQTVDKMWVEEALSNIGNKKITYVDLMDLRTGKAFIDLN